ncbi:MAG TPA: imidazole glycerol phosphate synthase subunit HisH [Phenylobacterium sp.]
MQSVALIDYGSGNLRSAEKALVKAAESAALESRIDVTCDPAQIARADRIVLPGVGAFAACMSAVSNRDGVVEAMSEAVQKRGAPFLGVCVGMQLLATRGLEFGETPGLGWIPGDVAKLTPDDPALKVPHMGWNDLAVVRPEGVLAGQRSGEPMYFTHSFAFSPQDEADVTAWSDHGGRFAAAVQRDNVAGVQFHPEKSQAAGLALLARFLEWRP